MALQHLTPHESGVMMSIEEGVAFLADTPYPVSGRQLYGMLTRAHVARERVGRGFCYLAADIMELHRDHVDEKLTIR